MKHLWKIVNEEIRGTSRREVIKEMKNDAGVLLKDPPDIANLLNNHFIGRAEEIARSVQTARVKNPMKQSHFSFFMTPVTSTEVLSLCQELKNKASAGVDEVRQRLK